ncbi:hypothetical protein CP533_3249 [Ophiocordyceps camponoti-saundersi (nom. inval.)]|nr:hypothetical protein CP533_3249 [Ophiocordyceps camponoti-saundersi (nom. inval.)]
MSRQATTILSCPPDYSPLYGLEDDDLIPSESAISRVFSVGQTTWIYFFQSALKMPAGLWPVPSLNPYLTIVDVPSLPDKVPRSLFLYGTPSWHASKPIPNQDMIKKDGKSKPDSFLYSGREIIIILEGLSPVMCDFSEEHLQPSSIFANSPKAAGSFGVLTMAWCYIFSARLLEMQGRNVVYSDQNRLWPNHRPGDDDDEGETTHLVHVCLDGASPALVRWLCSLLCPQLGWLSSEGGIPPWSVDLYRSNIVLTTDTQGTDALKAPSSSEALNLLVELCRLFDLGSEGDEDGMHEKLSPYRESFFAALLVPYYREFVLYPNFPPVCLERSDGTSFTDADEDLIRSYDKDLRYFMTISISPSTVNAILWSIFWQPDVDCNLASPWLSATLDILEPVIEARNLEILVKMFILRRPRVAPWWLAVFLLGDESIFERIKEYLEPGDPDVYDWTIHRPDPVISAWTGSAQTFIEHAGKADRLEPGLISRADLARCIVINQQRIPASMPLSWRPFGNVQWRDVAPEIRPYLATKPRFHYWHVTWDLLTEESFPSLGFRRETGRCIEGVIDDLDLRSSEIGYYHGNCSRLISSFQSKKATLRMMAILMRGIDGRRNWRNTTMPDSVKIHDWLFAWKGLDVKGEGLPGPEVQVVRREPSWFLMEWIDGKHEGKDEMMGMIEEFDAMRL